MFRVTATRIFPYVRTGVNEMQRAFPSLTKSKTSSQQLTHFVRHYYPRQRSYSQPSGSFFEKFGKPTLFTFGGIAGTYTIK